MSKAIHTTMDGLVGRSPLNPLILFYVIFLPMMARNLFPVVREKESISFASSFSDPQMVSTYLLALYLFYALSRLPAAVSQISRSPLSLFSLFIFVCFISLSVSAFPMMTTWRSFEILLVMTWGAMLLFMPEEYMSTKQLFTRFYIISSLMLFAVVVGAVFDPQTAWSQERHVERLTGSSFFMMGSNTVGVIAAIVAVAALSRFLITQRLHFLLASILTLIVCYFAGSRAGYLVLICTAFLVMVMLLRAPDRNVTATMILVAFSLFVLIGLLVVSPEVVQWFIFTFTRGYDSENLSTLDGRTVLWEIGWKAFLQSPFIGYGYGVYPKYLQGGHFHNVFIEILVTTGVAGLIPIAMLVIWTIIRLGSSFISFPYIGPEERIVSLDATIVGVGVLLSNMATAAVTHYSWHLIGWIIVLVALQRVRMLGSSPWR